MFSYFFILLVVITTYRLKNRQRILSDQFYKEKVNFGIKTFISLRKILEFE